MSASGSSRVILYFGRRSCIGRGRFIWLWGLFPKLLVCWFIGSCTPITVHCLSRTVPSSGGTAFLRASVGQTHMSSDLPIIKSWCTSKIPSIMHLLCNLEMSETRHSISIYPTCAGVDNRFTDALSCFNCQQFRPLVPEVQHSLTLLPSQLKGALISAL